MKKLLALLLALMMVLSIAACGNTDKDDTKPSETNKPNESDPVNNPPEETDPPEPVEPEALPASALNHWDFESADGLTTLHQIPRPLESELTGVGADKFDIVESVHEPIFAPGPVGNAVYLDGKYGIKLDMIAPTDDSYTIAFWYNADRFINLGPIIQMGRNIGMADNADPNNAVTWYNICQAGWGLDGAAIAPIFWNRNSSISTNIAAGGVWPWIGTGEDTTVYGKKEWVHVALVASGTRYVADDGMDRIEAKLYINGELKWDANAENLWYQGVSPEIFLGDGIRGIEAYVGINYWDACYKGFVDDLYVYDEALTAGQVLSLYQLGDASVNSVAPEYTGPTDDGEGAPEPTEPEALPAAPVDPSAIDTLGTPDRVLGFWSDNTDGFELPASSMIDLKLNNYSNGTTNWCNFVLAFTNSPIKSDLLAGADNYPGYAEYAVVRADAFGWVDGASFTFETSWGDDWAGWLKLMTNAKVDISIMRFGSDIMVYYTFTGADGTEMTENAVITIAGLTDDAPCYVHVTGEGAYIELLSVE